MSIIAAALLLVLSPPALAQDPCGDASGLQAGSPWPIFHGCPTHIGRSDFVAPMAAQSKWTYTFSPYGQIRSSPAIAADGTLYVSSLDSKLYAFK